MALPGPGSLNFCQKPYNFSKFVEFHGMFRIYLEILEFHRNLRISSMLEPTYLPRIYSMLESTSFELPVFEAKHFQLRAHRKMWGMS